jgi:hypothetical protein
LLLVERVGLLVLLTAELAALGGQPELLGQGAERLFESGTLPGGIPLGGSVLGARHEELQELILSALLAALAVKVLNGRDAAGEVGLQSGHLLLHGGELRTRLLLLLRLRTETAGEVSGSGEPGHDGLSEKLRAQSVDVL